MLFFVVPIFHTLLDWSIKCQCIAGSIFSLCSQHWYIILYINLTFHCQYPTKCWFQLQEVLFYFKKKWQIISIFLGNKLIHYLVSRQGYGSVIHMYLVKLRLEFRILSIQNFPASFLASDWSGDRWLIEMIRSVKEPVYNKTAYKIFL